MDAVAMSVRRIFFIVQPCFFANTFLGSPGTPALKAYARHATSGRSHASRDPVGGILAWPRKKFTKNFSIGKKSRIARGTSVNSTA
jgi:hypothetical protein